MTGEKRRSANAGYRLLLTGELKRLTDGKKRRLCLESTDSGRYVLIGSHADELYEKEEIKKVSMSGRSIRRADSAKESSVVEVLDYKVIP